MAAGTNIEWTDASWNPVVGCSIVSRGCQHCYAMKVAGARTAHTAKYEGLTQPSKAGPVWTGEVRFWEKALLDPLKWREPRMVFVNSMGDLFHEDVPDEWIDRCFAVMELTPEHTYQILTKRPGRMRDYMANPATVGRVIKAIGQIETPREGLIMFSLGWPLRNVWLGTSCEDQATADERIPLLLETPAAIRFVSLEPLLGPIDLLKALYVGPEGGWEHAWAPRQMLHWAIVGGESGRRARSMHPDWARSLRDQCTAAGVPYFFKQWGEFAWAPEELDFTGASAWAAETYGDRVELEFHSSGHTAVKIGKKAAGALLDGRLWREFPEVTT